MGWAVGTDYCLIRKEWNSMWQGWTRHSFHHLPVYTQAPRDLGAHPLPQQPCHEWLPGLHLGTSTGQLGSLYSDIHCPKSFISSGLTPKHRPPFPSHTSWGILLGSRSNGLPTYSHSRIFWCFSFFHLKKSRALMKAKRSKGLLQVKLEHSRDGIVVN